MTTPTSAAKNPNNAAKSRDDGKCALGGCSLMKAKIQLIPLRYGIVERLDPSSALAMPYKLESRPLGIRLIRDGWLYVIVEKKPEAILHEYRVQNGIVTQLLWEKGAITANKRENNVGEATLIFPRLSKLYVNYSEVQWTAAKCAQVIKHRSEREYFMQKIDLTNADPEKGTTDLLTESQAKKWIAEVAEEPSKDPAIAGAKPEESKDYLWEQTPCFKKTQLGLVKKQVKSEYERDHLYLIVQDDLGVLRDLAEHQDLVSGWLSDWSDAETNQKKYVFGSYIETLYTVTGDTLLSAAQGDPRFSQLSDETSPEQRQSIVDYVNTKNQTQWSGAGSQRGAISASKMRMRTSLGPLYSKYEDLIETIEENADDALNGAKMGQEGINDLIDRPAMESFLKHQRAQLNRWNKRLDLITNDRIGLISEQRFHRAGWYFDPIIGIQLEASLATEYACIKDICRTEKATEKLADLINKQPGFTVPTYFTLSLTDQKDLDAKIASAIKSVRDTKMAAKDYEGAQELSGKFGNLLTQHLAASMHLSENGITFDQMRNTAYEPAKQLRLADAMDESIKALRSGQPVNPAKLLRNIPNSAWVDVLRAFGKGGITLEFASASQIDTFKADMEKLTDLRRQMSALKNQIRQTLAKERKGVTAKGTHKSLIARRKSLQQTVGPLETRVARAMSPVGEGPGKAAFKIKGLTNAQVLEFERMVDDYRLKKPLKGLSREVFKSAGGDLFASAAAVMQIISFVRVSSEYSLKKEADASDKLALFNSFFSMAGGTFAAVQGIAITSLSVAIENYSSAAGKIKLAARLGRITGALSPFAYVFSTIAAGTGIYGEKGSAARWTEALRSGDGAKLAGASMTLAGDSGQLIVNGWAFARSGKHLMDVVTTTNQARSLAWVTAGGRLLSVAARANLIGLALTGLQLGGEWLYNRNNKSELDKWLQKGPWGKSNANRSMIEERLLLADISSVPQVALQKINNKPMVVLQFPGLTIRELDEVGLGLSAYWLTNHQRNDWEPWSEPMLYQLNLLSALDAPLKLGFEIFQNETNAQHGMAIALRYHPVAGEETFREKRFESVTLNAQSGKPFSPVSVLRTRASDAPWLVINSEALSSPNLTG
ncbi:toxin VasX [Pseudomonas kribbensis]|uniref:Toxin VasX N-terminal region domain-containing protein n=1 Tax=Pseudomonas kribbensis TaxID=1628086 RepID=A0A4Y8VQH9_9PSED|nr:toxin VasX [Pseudomonas kribbensis]TFH82608.1 hypothetical protein E4J90_04760 [Pseudomonas kribbensis]